MANGHGLGNHPLVVIIGVIAGLITVWSSVADKPPYISQFRSFVEKLIESPPSENQQTAEEEANRARKQAEQAHSEEEQRKAQEQTRALTLRTFEPQEAEAQRKAQVVKVDEALVEKLGLKIDKATLEKLQELGVFQSEVLLEP